MKRIRMKVEELVRLGLPHELGAEFESDMLDLMRARFRVVSVDERIVELTRLGWADERRSDPPPARRRATEKG